jgi:hypothetical protein
LPAAAAVVFFTVGPGWAWLALYTALMALGNQLHTLLFAFDETHTARSRAACEPLCIAVAGALAPRGWG